MSTGEGRHILIGDPDGDHQVWFVGGATARGSSFVVPRDDNVTARRHAIERLERRLTGQRAGPLMRSLQFTRMQRAQLTLQLRALDGVADGVSRREIAAILLDPQARDIPGIEWKNAALRKRINRIIARARLMVDGGYLALLRGEAGRARRFGRH